jgi:hypothetical protein
MPNDLISSAGAGERPSGCGGAFSAAIRGEIDCRREELPVRDESSTDLEEIPCGSTQATD